MKECKCCKKLKPLNKFYAKSGSRDGLTNFCKTCYQLRGKKWEENNKKERKEYFHKWYCKNTEKVKQNTCKWRKENYERNKAGNRIRGMRRYNKLRSNIKERLDNRMRTAIHCALHKGVKNYRSWESLVGFTTSELKKHLEGQFTKDMSWEKFLAGEIHIDHKIPKVKFNYKNPEDMEFKECWSLGNLQPLWAIDNRKKGCRIIWFAPDPELKRKSIKEVI